MYGPQEPVSIAEHEARYRVPGETFMDACYRLAGELHDDEAHRQEIKRILLDMRFLPGGRIQRAIGAPLAVTPYNCFVSGTIEDDSNSIMDRLREAYFTMRAGGGIGYDFSRLRPRGAMIKSLQSGSSGPVTFMEPFDAICKTVRSAGGRRGAQMGVLRVDHPSIEEFIAAKQNTDRLTAFNLSVGVTDAFMDAVKYGSPFDLVHDGKVYATIDARALWDQIMRATWDWAEPGVLFIGRINEMNNLWYCETLAATNPCVPAGTPILTRNGWQAIDELVGASVEVWNGEEWSRVEPRVTGYNQKLVTVHLSDGRSLRCTPAHRFLLADGRRVPASDLEIGDKLLKHSWPVIEGGADDEMAYQQGFFSGDGWFDRKGRAYIGLYGEKKSLVGEFVGATISREYAISGGYEGTDLTQTRIYAQQPSGRMRPKNFVPDTSWSVSSRLEWLAGLMDSDGCAVPSYNSVLIQISSKDRDFLSNVQLMLNTLGVASTLTSMKDYWRLGISANNLQRLTDLGLNLRRLEVAGNNPQRDASRFVSVVAVVDDGDVADVVYCFTEDKRHAGCFNGVLTGQCAEQPLPPYGACLLGSFNLTRYVRPVTAVAKGAPRWEFDMRQLIADIPPIIRMMDNIVDRAIYPLPQHAEEARSKRRMGIGVTGVANALEACGFPYASDGYIAMQSKILRFLRDEAYRASIALATEKGRFPLFDAEKFLSGEFVKTLPEEIQEAIAKHGIRNSHLLSIAPTGTISLTADNISSGIEPVFSYSQQRTIIGADMEPRTYLLQDYGVKRFGVRGRRADELTPEEHVDVLVAAQRYVDSAISKTCNVGSDVTFKRFREIYRRAYDGGAKGCTTFRAAGKRFGVLNSADEGASCTINAETGEKTCG